MPHRARLVKVEDLDSNNQNYITSLSSNRKNKPPSPPSSPLPAPPTPVVSTSQFRFPRKTSSSGTLSTSPSLPPPPMPPPPPPLIMPNSDEFEDDSDQYQPFPSYNPIKRIPLDKIRGNSGNLHDPQQFQYDRYMPNKYAAKDPKCSIFTKYFASLAPSSSPPCIWPELLTLFFFPNKHLHTR